jgi:hypothetical protein
MTETSRPRLADFPWHVLILPVLFPLFLFVRNYTIVEFYVAAAAMSASLLFSALLFLLFWLGFRNLERAALLTSFFTLFFFSFGHIYGPLQAKIVYRDTDYALPLIGPVQIGAFLIGAGITIVFLALWIVFYVWLRRHPRPALMLSRFLTVFSLSFAAIQIVLLIPKIVRVHKSVDSLQSDAKLVFPPLGKEELDVHASGRPDIYYILPDGYARNDVLMKYYNFDNSEFTDALKKEGFQIAAHSRSPYYWTLVSLGGILNMDYFLPNPRLQGPFQRGGPLANFVIRENRTAAFLKSIGYQYIQTSSTWDGTLHNNFADRFLRSSNSIFQVDYYRTLVETSFLRPFMSRENTDLAAAHMKTFQNLVMIAGENPPGPKFVFAHIVPPHPPYVFDANGKVLQHRTIADQFAMQAGLWQRYADYVSQLRFVNKKLLEIVRAIKANPDRKAVIIIGSDHGVHLSRYNSAIPYKQERFKNFIAVYSPNPAFALPDDINSINLMRLILNAHLGTSLPMRPAKNYYSPFEDPFAFEDATY